MYTAALQRERFTNSKQTANEPKKCDGRSRLLLITQFKGHILKASEISKTKAYSNLMNNTDTKKIENVDLPEENTRRKMAAIHLTELRRTNSQNLGMSLDTSLYL